MTASKYTWIDNILREWVANCDDPELLGQWENTISLRRSEIVKKMELTLAELCDALSRASYGDTLYPGKRVRVPWDGDATALRATVQFVRYNPEDRAVTVGAADSGGAVLVERRLNAAEISFYQLATKALHVRRAERARRLKTTNEET